VGRSGGAQVRGLGVAATFALVNHGLDPAHLSLAAGLAACRACRRSLPGESPELGLRWPNDVVERTGAQRKISGVLVESTPKAALIGFGINVHHEVDDFPDTLSERAASLRQLGSGATRLAVLLQLVVAFDEALALRNEELAAQWTALDTILGSRRTFVQGGRRYEGVVRSIQPSSHIEVETSEGSVQLPALSTSLVRE
jgi:BirA family biotin operon repressor/biotin-[acetyl-CoA-carboxylase] ligase